MSPTRIARSAVMALLVPTTLLVVLRARFTGREFGMDVSPYDVEPQLYQRNDDLNFV